MVRRHGVSYRHHRRSVWVGGGEIFIPLLIYIFGFSQHQAQGTSLAILLPPIGLLAALYYHNAGYVNFTVAVCWRWASSLALFGSHRK